MSPQIRDMRELDPLVVPLFAEWLRRCAAKGVPVLVYETYRTPERQDELYAIGRTEPGRIVTHARAGESKHQMRVALDAVPWSFRVAAGAVESKLDWTPFATGADKRRFREDRTRLNLLDPDWRVMVDAADALGIEWAGRWATFVEYVHFQMVGAAP